MPICSVMWDQFLVDPMDSIIHRLRLVCVCVCWGGGGGGGDIYIPSLISPSFKLSLISKILPDISFISPSLYSRVSMQNYETLI